MKILFPGQETLQSVLLLKLIPEKELLRTVRYHVYKNGQIEINYIRAMSKRIYNGLQQAGVTVDYKSNIEYTNSGSWLSLVKPSRVDEPGSFSNILITLSNESELFALTGELFRLGCDRLRYQLLNQSLILVKIESPPLYSVIPYIDSSNAYTAVNQVDIWISAGYHYPFSKNITPKQDTLTLIDSSGTWRTYPNTQWHDVYDCVDLQLTNKINTYQPKKLEKRLTIPLRLAATSHSEAPQVWILEMEAKTQLETLLRDAPYKIIEALEFAVLDDFASSTTYFILRARSSQNIPTLALEALQLSPLLGLNNLYGPIGYCIQPAIRHTLLVELLAASPSNIAWLTAHGKEGDFHRHEIPEASFLPVTDWVYYTISQHNELLKSWKNNINFDFEEFIAVDQLVITNPKNIASLPKNPIAETTKTTKAIAEKNKNPPPIPLKQSLKKRLFSILDLGSKNSLKESKYNQQLLLLEQQFMEMEVPLDDPQRADLWVNMALLAPTDWSAADLCWLNALWYANSEKTKLWVSKWIEVILTREGATDIETLLWIPLKNTVKTTSQTLRHVAAAWIYVASHQHKLKKSPVGSFEDGLTRLFLWLDNSYGSHLAVDIRLYWLLQTALNAVAGKDVLRLARARDRAIHRLNFGLSATDLPGFLRVLTSRGAENQTSVKPIYDSLVNLYEFIKHEKRERSALEAPIELSFSYIAASFAFSFAVLGHKEQVDTLVHQLSKTLDVTDPVHNILVDIYNIRILQAKNGESIESPLPQTLVKKINALDKLPRYKIERILEISRILDIRTRNDPLTIFMNKEQQTDLFKTIRGSSSSSVFNTFFSNAIKSKDTDYRFRVIDGLLNFLPRLDLEPAVLLLNRIVDQLNHLPKEYQPLVMESIMVAAGFFNQTELVDTMLKRLHKHIKKMDAEACIKLAPLLITYSKNLRRCGFQWKAEAMLQLIYQKIEGKSLASQRAQLHLAASMASIGCQDDALPIILEAMQRLQSKQWTVANRLELVRACAEVWTYMPRAQALSGLKDLRQYFSMMTDSFTTNSHFCLTLIAFVESLSFAHVSPDLILGDKGRFWLDEEEHQIRKRIFRDMDLGKVSL